MIRMYFAAILASLIALCATSGFAARSDCSTYDISTTNFDLTSATTLFVPVGAGSVISVHLEPDYTGIETGVAVSLDMCSAASADACNDYDFDSNADGVADTNILDASNTEKSGVKNISGFNYLLLTVSTAASATADPQVTVCRNKRD